MYAFCGGMAAGPMTGAVAKAQAEVTKSAVHRRTIMASTVTASADELRTCDAAPGVRRASALRPFFGVVAEPDSYRNLAYLLLGLPLGVVWFTALVTAVSVSASMLVVALLGIPMLLATWYLVRAFANVERGTANWLLRTRVPYAPIASTHRGNFWVRLRAMSREPDRWREAGFLVLRFPAGIATFTVAVTAISTPLWIAWAPFHARIAERPFGTWSESSRLEDVATSPWAWFLVPLGLLLLFVAFHALNGLARACGRWTIDRLGSR